jgi:pimeloyl-ACP methyl ester carboxylesterase
MQRRHFLALATGAFAAGAFGGYFPDALADATPSSAGAGGTLDAAAFRAMRRFARTTFGNIAYVDHGRGQAALFLHGFPLNSFQWRGAIERLSPHRRCIAPDLLGLGHTEVAPGQSLAPAEQAAMLVALLDRLGIEDVDLIANDSGGAVAQLFVARYPKRVRTLLLTNCDSEIECPPAALLPVIDLARQGRFVSEWLAPWHADTALARSPQGIGGMCFANPANPTDEAIGYYLTPLVRSAERTHAYAIALESNSLAGIAPALRQCTAPTRIVWGTSDDIFSKAGAEHLDRSFGQSRGVRWLEGSKLFWPEERPDVIAEEALQLWGVA